MAKFLENKADHPKFIEGEELVIESKDSYVKRKCKEKGIPEGEIHRSRPDRNAPRKFNAFREMNKIQEGRTGDLAKIPQDVEIVGKAPAVDGGSKRKREDGDDDRREKKERAPLTFEYKGVTLEIDDNGQVKNPAEVPFEDGCAIKFTVEGEGNWKELKTKIVETVIPDVFMALPAGAKVGTIAHQSSGKITDEEFDKLVNSGLEYAGNPITWERMGGMSLLNAIADRQTMSSASSGSSAPTTRPASSTGRRRRRAARSTRAAVVVVAAAGVVAVAVAASVAAVGVTVAATATARRRRRRLATASRQPSVLSSPSSCSLSCLGAIGPLSLLECMGWLPYTVCAGGT